MVMKFYTTSISATQCNGRLICICETLTLVSNGEGSSLTQTHGETDLSCMLCCLELDAVQFTVVVFNSTRMPVLQLAHVLVIVMSRYPWQLLHALCLLLKSCVPAHNNRQVCITKDVSCNIVRIYWSGCLRHIQAWGCFYCIA